MTETRTDDFSIALTSFFMKFIGFWVSADPVEQRRRDFSLTYTVTLVLLAVYVQTADFYYSKGDFTAYLFNGVNILSVLGGLLKICVLVPHKKVFFSLVHHLQQHFLNSDYDDHEKNIIHRCTSLCAIFVGLLTLFIHLTGFSYAVSPFIANIGRNVSNRVLPFNLWINLPMTMTPYYEIAFTLEVLSLYQICVLYFCFDNFLCIMNLHVASQFRILQYRLTNLRYKYDKLNLLGDLQACTVYSTKDVYVTFISYVRQHQVLLAYCKKLEAIYNLIVLGDILTFSLVICLNGVQALMTDSARRFIFLCFLLASFVHLLMFTYSCDGVMRESLKVATGVYNSPWCNLRFNKYGRMLQKGVILIIMRAKVPCYITARGFFPVTLETYTKVWSTAASYFMLLRQTLDDMRDTGLYLIVILTHVHCSHDQDSQGAYNTTTIMMHNSCSTGLLNAWIEARNDGWLQRVPDQCQNPSASCSKLKMFGMHTDDLSIAVTAFFMKVTGLWTAKNRAEKWSRNVGTFYTIFTMSLFIMVQSIDVIRGGLDFSAFLYSLVSILSVGNGLFKMLVLFVYKKDFLTLVVHLRRQFLGSEYDSYERPMVDATRSTCAVFIVLFTFFTHMTAFCFIIGPLIVSIGRNETDRLLPYNLWTVPFSLTPYYEITFFLQALLVYQSGVCHFCFDNVLCVMNLHVATQFRILQYRLSNLKSTTVLEDSVTRVPSAAENSYITFRRCVQQHQTLIAFCNKLEEVFNLIVLGQMLIFSLVICLNGLQVLMATTVAGRRYTFLFFLMTSAVQLLMFTYSCDGLIQESLNVATAVYASPWAYLPMDKYGKMLRNDVVLVIMRSRVPCCLTAKGFFPISLETYTKVWSTAASYFTLLRQTMDDLESS
ncbi:uncharacterized protein LOC143357628 [Halictus rubicundus]|uniref:uncharacterized protein LOC143357628 n=1 Tax=Halictus rubicundus TaxID=77578 RepID=UPI0040364955